MHTLAESLTPPFEREDDNETTPELSPIEALLPAPGALPAVVIARLQRAITRPKIADQRGRWSSSPTSYTGVKPQAR